ncbi:hypothetical protein IJ182_05440 [bacterium]|nr:hypothetical protein [bacterium]
MAINLRGLDQNIYNAQATSAAGKTAPAANGNNREEERAPLGISDILNKVDSLESPDNLSDDDLMAFAEGMAAARGITVDEAIEQILSQFDEKLGENGEEAEAGADSVDGTTDAAATEKKSLDDFRAPNQNEDPEAYLQAAADFTGKTQAELKPEIEAKYGKPEKKE